MSEYHISETGAVRKHPTRTFTKHFETTVTDAENWKIQRQLREMLRSANAKKFGRHRRGTVFLASVTSRFVAEGRYKWSLTFTTGSRFVSFTDPLGDRHQFERCGLFDYRPVLKRLSR